jgi:hypothetical protein
VASSGAKKSAGAGAPLPTFSAEELLGRSTLREEWVDVPEWGCRVKVRELSMGTYQQVQEKATGPRGDMDDSKLQAYLVLAGIVEPELGDDAYEWVRGQSMRAVNRVLEKVMALSGIGIGAIEDAEAMFPEATGDDLEVPASA